MQVLVLFVHSACSGGGSAVRDELPRLDGLVLYPAPIAEAPPYIQARFASAAARAEKRPPVPPVRWSPDLDEPSRGRWQ